MNTKKSIRIFCGSSNPKLGRKIAKLMGIKLGEMELGRFANGEARVWIKETGPISKAIVVQSFSLPPDQHLIEFCLICDALKRMGVKKIIAVIPWMGYCVQDKVFRKGEPLSSKVVAKIIQISGVNQVISLDLHNQTIEGFFDIPFIELFTTYPIIDYLKKRKIKFDAIVCPDAGRIKKSLLFSQALSLPLVTFNKERDLNTGKISLISFSGEIKGKIFLITDDFISTGGTILKICQYLKKRGAKKIYACLAHHFYIKGVQEKIERSPLEKLFCTDTVKPPDNKKYKKLEIISIAKHICQTLKDEKI